MPFLYVYNKESKELKQLLINSMLISIELKKYGILCYKSEFHNLEPFIQEVYKTYGFDRYDIKQIDSPMLSNDTHSHKHKEARMILRGEGRFYFNIDGTQLQLDVGVGDFVVIPENIIHYIKTSAPLTALRFFSTEDNK